MLSILPHATHAVLFDLETLQSPDKTFTLTVGSDYHLLKERKEHAMEWQQTDGYISATHKVPAAMHATTLEDSIFCEIEFFNTETQRMATISAPDAEHWTRRRTGNFLQDYILTPCALFLNNNFGTSFKVPPLNRGFLSNLHESLLKEQNTRTITNLEFRNIKCPEMPVQSFCLCLQEIIASLYKKHRCYKILDQKDFDLVNTLLFHLQKHADKTMAAVYADTTKIYPMKFIPPYSYAETPVTSCFTLKQLTDQVCGQLLDALTLIHIFECKAKGIKNLDLFMGGLHIRYVTARLKERGWQAVYNHFRNDVAPYFTALYAKKESFIGGIPVCALVKSAADYRTKLMMSF